MTVLFPYDRSSFLTLSHQPFLEDIKSFVGGLWSSDVQHGDITTETLAANGSKHVRAHVVSKCPGYFSGSPILEFFMSQMNLTASLNFHYKEGDFFEEGVVLLSMEGVAAEILKLERTVLNVLQRLCAITTNTRTYVERAAPIHVAATRKTQWGLLDKYAVAQGGGLTHRLHLGDAPLFKENHLRLMENPAQFFHTLFRSPLPIPFLTIEIENKDQALSFYEQLPSSLLFPVIFMFDDFSSVELTELLQFLPKKEGVYFEASGGIHLENLAQYIHTGVDVLSSGALTHSVPALDLSLKIL